MVAPVTGPYNTTVETLDGRRIQGKYKQAKPIDRPLPYSFEVATPKGLTGDKNNCHAPSYFFGPTSGFCCPTSVDSYNVVLSAAYAKLVGEVSDSAQFAVNLAEYRQSMGMMVNRIEQLIQFCRYMRKLDFFRAGQAIGLVDRKGNLAFKPKSFKDPLRVLADNWLEYSFGWKPLVEDIYSAVNHFQNPVKSIRPRGSTKDSRVMIQTNTGTPTLGNLVQSNGLIFAKQGCEVTVDNPNLYLANKLGLVNPATVVWELIPFSFVVDWFANVGEFLSSGTDFYGLTVTRPWSLWGVKVNILDRNSNPFWVSKVNIRTWNAAVFGRNDRLIGPSLRVRPWRLWGWQRGFNAASVLLQLLTKK